MKTKNILLIVLAAIVGEIALALFTTVAQEVLFNGIDFYDSSNSELLFGGLATLIAAILAGCVASLIIKNKSHWPHLIISLLIIAEMTYLVSTGRTSGPLLFSLLSGLSLIIGVWMGYYFMKRFSNKTSMTTS